MKELKIPEFKDPIEAVRWIMLITMSPFILYMFLTDKPGKQVTAKEFYMEKYNDSYFGKISEKEHDGNHSHKFRLNNGRAVHVSWSAYDVAEVGDSVWKQAQRDTLYIKMPDGVVLGFDEVSDARAEYRDELKKKR
ncbi:hypothetical protein ACLI1A_13140 [Flavobacterium sp. RHBU_3]|uniref:hypothetical protein n=1 Tax=Flavobacterium sp. RHBU_3 TaxID=3391184 RepID=UPI00398547A7